MISSTRNQSQQFLWETRVLSPQCSRHVKTKICIINISQKIIFFFLLCIKEKRLVESPDKESKIYSNHSSNKEKTKKKEESRNPVIKIFTPTTTPKVLSPFTHLEVKRNKNIQAARCVLGGKSWVKYCHLILNPPFRTNS